MSDFNFGQGWRRRLDREIDRKVLDSLVAAADEAERKRQMAQKFQMIQPSGTLQYTAPPWDADGRLIREGLLRQLLSTPEGVEQYLEHGSAYDGTWGGSNGE